MDNLSKQACTRASSSPLDCPKGLSCTDYECEWRHLDAIEQQGRDGSNSTLSSTTCSSSCFASPDRPKLIITSSCDMGRSASTWVFNAVRLLHRKARIRCDSYWIRELTPPKLHRRIATAVAAAAANVLIKTHEWTDTRVTREMFEKELCPLFTHVIVSVRQGGFPVDPHWMAVATLVVRYETIVLENPCNNPNVGSLSVFRNMANHLGITNLTDEQLVQVDYELMTLPIPGDQSTKFWSFHQRRGGPDCANRASLKKKHTHTHYDMFLAMG